MRFSGSVGRREAGRLSTRRMMWTDWMARRQKFLPAPTRGFFELRMRSLYTLSVIADTSSSSVWTRHAFGAYRRGRPEFFSRLESEEKMRSESLASNEE